MDNKVEENRKKTGGRKPGVPNKTTQEAREAIKALLDANIPFIQSWIQSTAEAFKESAKTAKPTRKEMIASKMKDM